MKKIPASALSVGDHLPLLGFGVGPEIGKVTDEASGVHVQFTEPVESRWNPGYKISGIHFSPSDMVTVLRGES